MRLLIFWKLLPTKNLNQPFKCTIESGERCLEMNFIFRILRKLDLLIHGILVKGRLIWSSVK
ncbi:hypothetical protein SAMN04490192_4444 [Pseudomonas lundensis]|nr:hypothetical protein SAMN04490192_4444 [Pseudomonas lundensis]